jgi:chemotaxis response regulator CheB
MVVLCVARHLYLAQHLARVLAQAGAVTRAAVGFDEARTLAGDCAPDVIAAEYDLLATLPRRAWEHDEALSRCPVVAVSLTRPTGESNVLDKNGIGGHLYLPEVGAPMVMRMLQAAASSGVRAPDDALAWPGRTVPQTAP